ncbi:MAG: Gfo/Idh/MocA family oxidoreductase, partial [Candidatus Ratteibacteria bacterium]
VNGRYNSDLMKECGYPVIVDYLSKQPAENLGISDAYVTHVWTEDKETAIKVAKTTYIEHVIDNPEQAIGKVDAAVITTDIGSSHVSLAKPFIEAGLPVFIDKPLVDNEEDLKTFYQWHIQGKKIMSCSSMRYAKEIKAIDFSSCGKIEFISGIMSKSWERYGVHAVEGLCTIAGFGIKSILNTGNENLNLALVDFKSGLQSLLQVIYYSTIFGRYDVFCRNKTFTIETKDYFYMFKSQLEDIVKFVKTGVSPFPFSETVEIIKAIIAGIKSRKEKRKIYLDEINLDN